jgi:hypothetical protein
MVVRTRSLALVCAAQRERTEARCRPHNTDSANKLCEVSEQLTNVRFSELD